MTNDEALRAIQKTARAGGFIFGGDVLAAMGGHALSDEDVCDALANATECEACPAGWRVMTTDRFGDPLIVEIRLDTTPWIISLGPTL